MHAGVIDDELLVPYLRIACRYVARATQKQAVAELHDVGLVYYGDLLAAVGARVGKGAARDAETGLFADDLEAFDHARNHFVLQPGIEALGVFPKDHQVDGQVGEAAPDAWQPADRAKIGVKIEDFPKRHVDAGKAAADRRGKRTLQRHPGAVDRVQRLLGKM